MGGGVLARHPPNKWYQSKAVQGCRLQRLGARLKMEKIGTIKMEINKFDGKSNFSLWQARVKDVLIQ